MKYKDIDINFARHWLIKHTDYDYEFIKKMKTAYINNDALCFESKDKEEYLNMYAVPFLRDYNLFLFLKDLDDDEFKKLINQLERLKEAIEGINESKRFN